MDRITHGTPERAKRYLMIELACKDMKCSPCTYPNCQRFVRELPKVRGLKAKVLEVDRERDDAIRPAPEKPGEIDRYVLVEISCRDAKCSPCTYPSCQRFARQKKLAARRAGPEVSVTEVKGDRQFRAIMKEK